MHSISHVDFEVFTVSIHKDYIDQLLDSFGLKYISNKQEVIRMDMHVHVEHELRNLAMAIVNSSGGESAQIAAHTLAEKLILTASTEHSKK